MAVPAFLTSPTVPAGAVSVSAPAYRTPLARLIEDVTAIKKNGLKLIGESGVSNPVSGQANRAAPFSAAALAQPYASREIASSNVCDVRCSANTINSLSAKRTANRA